MILTNQIEPQIKVSPNYARTDLGIPFPNSSTPQGQTDQYVSNVAGKDTLAFRSKDPNFLGDYTRSLVLSASHEGRNVNKSLKAFVTGSKQFHNDFTLEPPDQVIMVLHDPPGDGSSLSWNTTSSAVYSSTHSFGVGGGISADFSVGTDIEHYTGVWAGVGGGALGMTKIIDSENKALFTVGNRTDYTGSTTNTYAVNYGQTVTTDPSLGIKGEDNDIFVGYSSVITMGTGKELSVSNCVASVEENVAVATFENEPPFFHTSQHIQDVLIPNLETIRDQYTPGVFTTEYDEDGNVINENVDVWQVYQDKIEAWEDIIEDNEDKVEDVENLGIMHYTSNGNTIQFPDEVNFSAGSNVEYTIADENSTVKNTLFTTSLAFETAFENSFGILGVTLNTKTELKFNFDYECL